MDNIFVGTALRGLLYACIMQKRFPGVTCITRNILLYAIDSVTLYYVLLLQDNQDNIYRTRHKHTHQYAFVRRRTRAYDLIITATL